jgi:rubrerythrin
MDWSPFAVCAPGAKPPAARSMATPEGLGDRLRTAAFAELQAREAFRQAAERFDDAPAPLRQAWRRFSAEEGKHLGWLLRRMDELGVAPDGRPVSDGLYRSLARCAGWREFAAFMARAEDRGRTAERHFEKELAARDPETAAIFKAIADEEDAHIRAQTSGL